ncbi:hypothetical protein DFH28DRAFT_404250 [Melampsora americana]|nr:hypothetical protein DFH28DRAFT_404250 [Melampsora americana]
MLKRRLILSIKYFCEKRESSSRFNVKLLSRLNSSIANLSVKLKPNQLTHEILSSLEGQKLAKIYQDELLYHPLAFENLKNRFKDLSLISFSRSGGKGGQNVNKVNTKVTLKIEVSNLIPILPNYWITNLSKSHLYASTSNSIIIQSTLTRSQSQNLEDCWKRLFENLKLMSKIGLKGLTSIETIEKVKRFQSIEKSKNLKQKKYRHQIKVNRSKPKFD